MRMSTRIFALCLSIVFPLGLSVGGTPVPPQNGTYDSTTRAALDRIIQANDQILAGKPDNAQNLLRGMAEPLRTLETLAQQFRERANREHDRCMQRIGDLERRISDLYAQQLNSNKKIGELDALLKNAVTRRDLAEAEIAKLNQSINATKASLRARQAQLEAMAKDWLALAFGGGQYLAIQALVNDDIGRTQRALRALADEQRMLEAHRLQLSEAQRLKQALESEKRGADELYGQLTQTRSSAQSELRELKASAVFLMDADVFWGKAQTLLQVDAKGFISTMSILQDVLGRDVEVVSFTEPSHAEARKFREMLIDFAQSVDANSNFLLQDKTRYCSVPSA